MTVRDMVARHSEFDETEDFIPTPPWATRVLYEYVAPDLKREAPGMIAYDPACGQGHMMQVFHEYGHRRVFGSDFSAKQLLKARERLGPDAHLWHEDYVGAHLPTDPADAIITNPPYKYLNGFVDMALDTATFGVGMLCRIQALESEGRYNNIYKTRPPTQIAFFSNRIPFKTGVVAKKAPKMFFHVWLWWERYEGLGRRRKWADPRPPMWVPYDAQTQLEKDSDYVE